jgi:hypothetical protein
MQRAGPLRAFAFVTQVFARGGSAVQPALLVMTVLRTHVHVRLVARLDRASGNLP